MQYAKSNQFSAELFNWMISLIYISSTWESQLKAVWIMPLDLDLHCFQISTFTCFCCRLLTFFSDNYFKKFIQHLMVWIQIKTNELHVGPDPRPNCSEKISADYKSHPYLGSLWIHSWMFKKMLFFCCCCFFILMISKVCFHSLSVLLCKKTISGLKT